MQIKIAILILAVVLLSPIAGHAAEQPSCLAVDSSLSCSSLGAYANATDRSACGTSLPKNALCCCPEATDSVNTSPKLLVIGSVVAFFAIITILTILFKKND